MPWPRASGNRIQFSHENGKLMGVLAPRPDRFSGNESGTAGIARAKSTTSPRVVDSERSEPD
jgi:hypothetical protein